MAKRLLPPLRAFVFLLLLPTTLLVASGVRVLTGSNGIVFPLAWLRSDNLAVGAVLLGAGIAIGLLGRRLIVGWFPVSARSVVPAKRGFVQWILFFLGLKILDLGGRVVLFGNTVDHYRWFGINIPYPVGGWWFAAIGFTLAVGSLLSLAADRAQVNVAVAPSD